MNILIVYGTRFGKTRETAATLGSTLRDSFGHTVTISSYKLSKEIKAGIKNFGLLIAGSSIVAGMWKSGVKRILKKYKNDKAQASRIMWRVILDWIDSQMTMIEIGQRSLLQIFFADVTPINSLQTLFDKSTENGFQGYLIEDNR